MSRKSIIPILILAAAAAAAVAYARRDHSTVYFTGFVEGEERVLRSEVSGRVIEVRFAEGATIPPGAVVALLDDRDIQAKIRSKQEEIRVIDADLHTQEERIALVDSTWEREVSARAADVRQAEAAAELAQRTLSREQELVKTGASTAQLLDDNRSRRDQATSGVERARQILARTEAEGRQVILAQTELTALQRRRALTEAQLEELQVLLSKHTIVAPPTGTTAQTQFIWPGELAQPGTAVLSVLDPADKYVQFYVPVTELHRVHVGQRVGIELDSNPGHRTPGEISFIADKANFTPEKIETRSDRVGQVYRVKVRILENVERMQPGTEGNIYLGSDNRTAER